MLTTTPLISRLVPPIQPIHPIPQVSLQENLKNPFRSGRVDISVGKTTYEHLTQAFIMIDHLDWLFRLKPSFVMLFPSEKALQKDGDRTNITVLYPKEADTNVEFNILSEGRAYLSTYFFGEPKEDRTFDFFFRFFEVGFRMTAFEDLDKSIFRLYEGTEISISSEKYKHPSILSGDTGGELKVRARVSRKN